MLGNQLPDLSTYPLPTAEPMLQRALPSRRKALRTRAESPVAHGRHDHAVASGFSAVVDFAVICFTALGYFGFTDNLPPQRPLLVVGYALAFLFCANFNRLYRAQLPLVDTAFAVFKSTAAATLAVAAVFYFQGVGAGARPALFVVALCAAGPVTMWRAARILHVRKVRAREEHCTNVLIIGAGKTGRELEQQLAQPGSGYRVVGFLDDHALDHPRVLGKPGDLAVIARTHFVDEVVVTIASKRDLVKRVALHARKLRLDVKLVPELYDGMALNAPVEYLAHLPVRVLHREPIPAQGWLVKRIFDIVFSGLAVLLLAPVFVVCAVAIWLDSGGPMIYRSQRVGRKGRLFTFYKFRTMVNNADALKEGLEARNERNGILFKLSDDPRITRVGRILRRFSVDEFPQFFNVLKGDMSLVGPRPPLPSEFKRYRLDHLRRLDVQPGITGLWQISSRRDPSFENYVALDLEYIENWSLGLDFKIMVRTIPAMLTGTGV
ncbi:MAG TPA: sugar transferase [Candidatus Angelobacter sp.]|jgi:exopolysaccharide biosynthesis polyprenyl glycosylphosphotransferase|nr:sugar transferase [Candidatus Angelobacter sp.]